MAIFPLGGLVSFAGYSFDPTRSTYATNWNLEWATSYVSLPDASFPIDLWYNGPAPLKSPQATWVYLLQGCDAGTAGSTAEIEQEYGAIMNALLSSTGQKGTLTVQQLSGGTVSCKARIEKAPLKLTPGKNSTYFLLELTWTLLSPFS